MHFRAINGLRAICRMRSGLAFGLTALTDKNNIYALKLHWRSSTRNALVSIHTESSKRKLFSKNIAKFCRSFENETARKQLC